ncbi:putative bifunctional diguanylate cyclase/phosphodiesterase [Tumebacillus permanentifrigoris]|uniref:PAS domain S-box-containing protein/diguanylate cyclase (GGDEF)-like protein n=1 Tax=Tumebacillus permanentifrigoris TaxID=378543 RepID=A0A316D3C8_9BACL|nr:EAL domain-containing protein [Tumebacillus permanentifrigoris]PWK05712.1 PAS domain S-box-containing protein/diguanylate cyclase (GGDEF)-like protein [Tumebacillus permanentifrigoris]
MKTLFHDVIMSNMDYIVFVAIVGAFFLSIELIMHRYMRSIGLTKPVLGEKFSMGRAPVVAAVIVFAILFAGWFVVEDGGEQQGLANKRLVEGIAPTFSYELQKMGHQQIRIATPPNDPMYQTILTMVSKWLAINPEIERIYTLRKLPDGTNVFVIAPETFEGDVQHHRPRKERTPIGQPYMVESVELEDAFHGEKTFRIPLGLEAGETISAYVPIVDKFGITEAVLGIDYDAAIWESKISSARRNLMFFLIVLLIPVHTTYWVVFTTRVERFRLKHHAKELSESEDRFRKLSNATFEGIVIADEGQIIDVNQTFASMFGYKQSEMLGMPLLGLVDTSSRAELQDFILSEDDVSYEILGLRADGTQIAIELVGTPCFYEGRIARVVAVRDITERKQAQEIINHMAYHDTLTNLPNRVLFNDRLAEALELAAREGQKLAVMFLDLDRFKLVNDTLGHTMGDKLLKGVAARVSHCVRAGDIVARMGGDEFTILLPNLQSEDEAVEIAQKVIQALAQPFVIDDYELHTTTSIGISLYPEDGQDTQVLMKNADTAMYRAKDQGRNNYRFYAPTMNMRGIERLELENGLRYAVERNELVVYYQPRVNIVTGQIMGMEALVRWEHPQLGLVSPGQFIPLAEETGLIVPIGEWVMQTACRQNKAWQEAGYPPMHVAVNLSARQFQRPGLVERVREVLAESNLEPQYLELEITESITMHDVDFTIATLRELSNMGVLISIDDFGTGYSSLTYLKHFPINTLKIDQSFVREITIDPYNAAIVTTVIYLAQNLKLKVIAEGVETEEQLSYLRDHECDEMQGYLFSRPVPADEFEKLLKARQIIV